MSQQGAPDRSVDTRPLMQQAVMHPLSRLLSTTTSIDIFSSLSDRSWSFGLDQLQPAAGSPLLLD